MGAAEDLYPRICFEIKFVGLRGCKPSAVQV